MLYKIDLRRAENKDAWIESSWKAYKRIRVANVTCVEVNND